eukprot:scaffold95652_cov22-Prasinocladus_malaysianus.AAC.1
MTLFQSDIWEDAIATSASCAAILRSAPPPLAESAFNYIAFEVRGWSGQSLKFHKQVSPLHRQLEARAEIGAPG